MINFQAINKKVVEIKNMRLDQLFNFGREIYIDIKIYEEHEEKGYLLTEIDDDRNYADKKYLNAVVNTIMEKKYGITDNIESWKGYYFATFNEYLDECVSRYFLLSMQKGNVFCRKVVAHYILRTSFNCKIDIAKEVDRWIDYHNSEEFKKSIAGDVFSIMHYIMGLAKMVNDCFNDERANKNV